MFFVFVNYEKPIPYFNIYIHTYIYIYIFVLGGERHKMSVKRLIYPSFLTEVGYELLTEGIIGG